MATILDMKRKTFLEEVQAYCAAAGISPSTLGVRVLGNSRYFDRLERRLEKAKEDEIKIRRFIQMNPPPQSKEAAQ